MLGWYVLVNQAAEVCLRVLFGILFIIHPMSRRHIVREFDNVVK